MPSVVYERLFHLGLCLILISGEAGPTAEWKDGSGGGRALGPSSRSHSWRQNPRTSRLFTKWRNKAGVAQPCAHSSEGYGRTDPGLVMKERGLGVT